MTALLVQHVSHRFGDRTVLADVSFTVEPGAFTVLLGLNGAGKTTLVSLAAGLYQPQAGAIRIFGHSLREARSGALAKLGVVFQTPSLDLDLTVAENLAYHASLHGLSSAESAARADAELARLGLAERKHDIVRSLSGGLRRRLEIARTLLHRPQLLILDEPTVGLDAASRSAILAHMRDLRRELGLSVLWATHLMDEVEPDDVVLVLHRGRLLWTGRAHAFPGAGERGGLALAFLQMTGAAA